LADRSGKASRRIAVKSEEKSTLLEERAKGRKERKGLRSWTPNRGRNASSVDRTFCKNSATEKRGTGPGQRTTGELIGPLELNKPKSGFGSKNGGAFPRVSRSGSECGRYPESSAIAPAHAGTSRVGKEYNKIAPAANRAFTKRASRWREEPKKKKIKDKGKTRVEFDQDRMKVNHETP